MKIRTPFIFISMFCFSLAGASAEPRPASVELRDRFVAILRREAEQVTDAARISSYLTAAEKKNRVEMLTSGLVQRYDALISLPEDEAKTLLQATDDVGNCAAIADDLGAWQGLAKPLPGILAQMLKKIDAGEIAGGLPLELAKRMSDFHLREIGLKSGTAH